VTAQLTATAVPPKSMRDIVDLACRAPSVHNTQPWAWRVEGNTIELYADPRRRLPAADTRGRNLTISCGGALHHAQVAARALGWEPTVTRLPKGSGSTLLALIELTPAPPSPDAAVQLQALRERCTDRRQFTSWPVPGARLWGLAATATKWGAHALPVLDPATRVRAEILVGRALDRQAADPRLAEEQQRWVDHGERDGVPAAVIPETSPSAATNALATVLACSPSATSGGSWTPPTDCSSCAEVPTTSTPGCAWARA